ncbi:hypothetical protein BMETH_1123820908235, partial [methanotrophic bacterial endosymbiont of Bathymodiolus sp.]
NQKTMLKVEIHRMIVVQNVASHSSPTTY